jgi:hypothetical protein
MDTERLAHIEDLTRRYGKYRPGGAGLGAIWGGLLLGTLGALLLQWTRTAYAARAVPAQTLWRFLRDTPLPPPGWLQLAAIALPVVAWLGLLAIQTWVDRRFGAVTTAPTSCARPRGPLWMAPFVVVLLACLLSGALIVSDGTAAARGVAAMLAIAAWAFVWGRGSRDQLTLMVMLAVSVPSVYLMAATDPQANFAAGNLIIFGAYFVLMLWLLVQGIVRLSGFLKVRADLAAIQPEDE